MREIRKLAHEQMQAAPNGRIRIPWREVWLLAGHALRAGREGYKCNNGHEFELPKTDHPLSTVECPECDATAFRYPSPQQEPSQ